MTRSVAALTPSAAADLAMSAIAGQGRYGAVTNLAEEYDVSRQSVYDIRGRALDAIDVEFDRNGDSSTNGFMIRVTEADIKRAVIAMRVTMPASIRDEVAVLPIIYSFGWSYGKIQGVLAEASERARRLEAEVDLSAIKNIALDEMFSQGRPVFGGIDLDTQYLFDLEVHKHRAGEDWEKSLSALRDSQNLNPKRVVKDAGTGLAKGVQSTWPGVDENDDVFHALLMIGREAYHLERRAYSAINQEYELEKKSGRARTEQQRRSLGQRLRKAREHRRKSIDCFDRFESLRFDVKRLLDLADRGSGRLRTGTEVVETLTRVADEMAKLAGGRIGKVARYLRNRATGLARYLDSLGKRLQQVTDDAGGPEVVAAVVRAYQASIDAHRGGPAWDSKARGQEMRESVQHLLAVTDREPKRLKRALDRVVTVLGQRYRASSAIENLNSVLRPYLVVQKNVQQGFLDLFRFYWNHRCREWGRGKGTSPYEALTGQRVDDWLTLLGYPPSAAFAAAS